MIKTNLNKNILSSYSRNYQYIIKFHFSNWNTLTNNKLKEEKSIDKISFVQKLNHLKNPIFTSIFTLGLAINGYYVISMWMAGLTIYQATVASKRLQTNVQNYLDEKYTTLHNNKVIYAVEEIKKYICYHPELKRYFPLDLTNFRCISWSGHRHNFVGAGYRHEENLVNKRWNVSSEILNESNDCLGKFECYVLFHNPTHFVIEYLRVDIYKPIFKKITIIDGRKNMKNWVEEIQEDKIDKRVYPKYREDDNVKY